VGTEVCQGFKEIVALPGRTLEECSCFLTELERSIVIVNGAVLRIYQLILVV
jgi:hypothetical protein